MFYTGIDISKNSFNYCIIDQSANILKQGSLNQSSENFKNFINIIQSFSPNTIVVESSGRYHIPLTHFLLEHNASIFVINPKAISKFSSYINHSNPSKTDKKDAFIIALFALKNPEFLKSSPIPSDLKILARQISQIKHQISKTKSQILYNLSVLFPEVEKHFNPFSKSFLNILLSFPSAKHIAKAHPLKLKKIILASSKRPPSFSPQCLKSIAKSSIGISQKGLESSLKFLIKQLFFLENQLIELEKTLENEISKNSENQIHILSSIKGISKKLSALFLAEIENIKKFSNAKKLIKYAGTDPVVKQSGKWKLKKGISKQGNPFLRYILYQMATGVVT